MELEISRHALDMLKERELPEAWVRDAVNNPDWKIDGLDGNVHYFRGVPERDGRFLHVVINAHVQPVRVVTVFLDRRARRPE